jgi:hypothetical protein
MNIIIRFVLLGLSMLSVVASVDAQTPPARRAGLWEVRQGPAGMKDLPALKLCLSAAEANGDIGKERMQDKSCNDQRLSSSPNEVRWRNVCRQEGDTMTMEGRAYDIKPDSFKADMQMSGSMGAGVLHAEWRWLGPDCGPAR